MKSETIPVLITWDVDPDRWTTLEKRQEALTIALDLCESFGIRSTFFITANFAQEYPSQIQRMCELGQEIGCHGLTHADEEEYDRMSEDLQRRYIQEATRKLKEVVGAPIQSFRSPRVKTSGRTLKLLGEFGYLVDSSVCSQRIDFISSNLINPGWITAPRRPYHPNENSAYKHGGLPILELPVSALVVPMISGSLNVFGLGFMKAFFRLLSFETAKTGKPIVYLAHTTELLPSLLNKERLSLNQFTPAYIRTHGLMLRKVFYRMTGEIWQRSTRELFGYMASTKRISFMTCSQYLRYSGKSS